jgi:ATP-dependent DNA helicase RecG
MNILDAKITSLAGVGSKKADIYAKVGVASVADLLNYLPRDYMAFDRYITLDEAPPDCISNFKLTVTKIGKPVKIRQGLSIAKIYGEDESNSCEICFFNSNYVIQKFDVGKDYFFRGKLKIGYGAYQLDSPKFVAADDEKLILPVYPLTAGLTQEYVRGNVKQALRLLNEDCEILPPEIIEQNQLTDRYSAYQNVHFPATLTDAAAARERLSFDEMLLLRVGMKLAKKLNSVKLPVKMTYKPELMAAFEANLPFDLTAAQRRSVSEITADMRGSRPMNRLLQGDVGSGKTAVAAAAMAFAFGNGFQSALMAPTEILAVQHFTTLEKLLKPLGITVGLLTGSLSAKEKKAIREKLKSGEISAAVGTHALIADATEFDNLGLIVTDEQHRFGVNQRAKLSEKGGLSAHKLVMSATPIPRTLGLIIYGDLDISILDEKPGGRLPVETFAVTSKLRERAYAFVEKEIAASHQVYAVCPAIDENRPQISETTLDTAFENAYETAAQTTPGISGDEDYITDETGLTAVTDYEKRLKARFPQMRIAALHGKMDGKEKDAVMSHMNNGEIDILVSTTVIEVGVDVPNATIMLIEDADRFGLSQIHQLRGRVGRGAAQSYCILITSNRTEAVKERLRYLSSTTDGFKIAEYDLETRGAGDFLGSRQHGLPKLKTSAAASKELIEKAETAAESLFSASPDLELFPMIKNAALTLFESIEVS